MRKLDVLWRQQEKNGGLTYTEENKFSNVLQSRV